MPLKDRARDLGHAALSAARVGAVCLGCAVIVWSDDPAVWLGVGGALVGLTGGAAARYRGPLGVRVAACGTAVIAVRIAGGTAVAALVSVLFALGWWLRLRTSEVFAGVAVYGVVVAGLGRASWQLLTAFWALGAMTVAAHRVLKLVRRRVWNARNLAGETGPALSLDRETR